MTLPVDPVCGFAADVKSPARAGLESFFWRRERRISRRLDPVEACSDGIEPLLSALTSSGDIGRGDIDCPRRPHSTQTTISFYVRDFCRRLLKTDRCSETTRGSRRIIEGI